MPRCITPCSAAFPMNSGHAFNIMRNVLTFAISVSFLAVSSSSVAQTPGARPFDSAAFARAQAENQIILVETYAPWCLTCRVQGPIIADLLRRPAFAEIAIFKVTAETPNRVWKQFKVRNYGALIVFRGATETGRTLGASQPDAILQILQTSLP